VHGYGGVQIPFAFLLVAMVIQGCLGGIKKAGRQNQRYATYAMLVGEEKVDGYSHQMEE
jgi:hypothetical protein